MGRGKYNLETLTEATFFRSCIRNLTMLVRGVNESDERLDKIETNLGSVIVTDLDELVSDHNVENGERHLMMGYE